MSTRCGFSGYGKIIKNAGWNALASVMYRGAIIIAMLITARIIGKAEFGMLGMIQANITLFESVTMLGMTITATKYIAQYRGGALEKVNRIISLVNLTSIITGVVFSFVLSYSSDYLAVHVLNNPGLAPYLKSVAMIVGLNAFSNIQGGILAGFESFRLIALANVINGISFFCLLVSGAFYEGLFGAVRGMLIGACLTALVNFLFVVFKIRKERISFKFKITKEELAILKNFSIPAMLSGLFFAPVNWLGASILVNMPDGYSHMGIFNAANQWFSALLFLPGVVSNTMLPMFSAHGGNKNFKELRALLWRSIKILLIVSVPMALIVSVLSELIMSFYGPGFKEGYFVLIWISVAAALASIQNLLSYSLAAIDKIWLHTFSNFLWSVVYLCSVILLTNEGMGAVSLSGSMAIAYLIKLILTGFFASKHVSVKN